MKIVEIMDGEHIAIKIKLPSRFQGPRGNCDTLICEYCVSIFKMDDGPNCTLNAAITEIKPSILLFKEKTNV